MATLNDKAQATLFYNIVLESIILAAIPDAQLKNEREPTDYIQVIKMILEHNEHIEELFTLENLQIFVDGIEEENDIISIISQLLGDKLQIKSI